MNSIRLLAASLTLSVAALSAVTAAPSDPIPLWPAGAPGDTAKLPPEGDLSKPTDGKPGGKDVIRLGNVTNPTLTVYSAPADKNTGAAVIVCPGGGYSILAYDLEGSEVCEWLNSIGVTGVLLKYRVPTREGDGKHVAQLQDAQRALGLVRQHAADWKIDSKRIGILGFSAGGHLSANASNNYAERAYPKVDAADDLSCRPDFSILIYPAYLTKKDEGDKLSAGLDVNAQTPPTFLVQTEDDAVRPENALFYYAALTKAKVPSELHLYPHGGHGYGLRPSEQTVSHWPQRAEEWMRAAGLLNPVK